MNEVAAILSDAFSQDPMMNWIFRDPQSFEAIFRELASGLYLRKGFGHLIDGVAATLWLPPGVKVKIPFLNELGIARAVIGGGGLGALKRATSIGPPIEAAHPHEPHYYLFAVGVAPAARGKGLGGMIIREALAMANNDNAPAYLENSNPLNAPLYQSLGFETAGNIKLPASAPPLVPMLRAAKSAA